MNKPVVIEVGLNEGATKAQNPTVAYSPSEIARDVIACAEAGAAIVHFHARDPVTGANQMNDTELYREAILEVRRAGCDVLLYPTYPPYESDLARRFQHVRALAGQPELSMCMGPLDMGSFNLIQFENGRFCETAFLPLESSIYCNPFQSLRDMLGYFRDEGLIPSLAVFEPGHLRTILAFMDEGLIRGTPLIKFFFSDTWLHGLLPDRQGLESYLHIIEESGHADRLEWICVPYAVTSDQRAEELLDAALELGGHVRVGVGDNPATSAGRTNAALVASMVERAKAKGRVPAAPADVLQMCAPN